MKYKVTFARTINNEQYGGNPYENIRLEITCEGSEGETFEELADESKKKIEEWTDMIIREIECEQWGLTPDEYVLLDEEAKQHLSEANRAVSRKRYHLAKARIIQERANRNASN